MNGTKILNYTVGAELGKGGLGTVYAAEHTLIGRKAALKVLNAAVSGDEGMVARFLAEARAVNAIRHPNIVDITDYGQANGVFFIVMELLEGETLARRLEKKTRLDEHQALTVLFQIASAVGAAHENGIVHRDLKPENIFLTAYRDYPDFVKVLDFGIAKLMGANSTLKTSPGLIIGTPAYMSPEQCLGEETLDHRSDIYSLGVVAYHMLTGQLPFHGNLMQMMQGHMSRPVPPPRLTEPRLSEAVERIVLRCMARAPEERFQSMRELRRELSMLGGRAPLAYSAEELPGGPAAAAPGAVIPSRSAVVPTAEVVAPPPQPPPPAPSRAWPPPSSPVSVLQAVNATSSLRPPTSAARGFNTFGDEQTERAQAVSVAAKMREIINKRLQSDSLTLPSLPEVAMKCLELAHDQDVHFASLARIIERDPFIASRVLRVVNSPLYGGMVRITTIDGAVSRMGMSTLVGLLQELAAEQVFTSRDPTIRNAFRGIWEHCLGVAHLSRHLAGVVRGTDPNTAYLCGLFHDIGKPVVAAVLLEAERSTPEGKAWLSGGAWRRVVDECHREVGAFIAYRWFLPREVAAAIAELDSYDLKRGRSSCVNVVRLANALCQREGLDVKAANADELARVVLQGRQLLGLSDAQLAEATAGLVDRVHALTTENQDADSSTRVFDRTTQ